MSEAAFVNQSRYPENTDKPPSFQYVPLKRSAKTRASVEVLQRKTIKFKKTI